MDKFDILKVIILKHLSRRNTLESICSTDLWAITSKDLRNAYVFGFLTASSEAIAVLGEAVIVAMLSQL